MNEQLLYFIWQFQYFNPNELVTLSGKELQIVSPGKRNRGQGPDFSGSRIMVDGIEWVGNVEIHVLASDWKKHGHGNDGHYGNVILHVVWEMDVEENTKDVPFPTLVLKNKVSKLLLERYFQFHHNNGIACKSFQVNLMNEIGWLALKDRLLAERLERKATALLQQFNGASGVNWEEIFWISLAKSFGQTANATLFEEMAKTVSVKLLAKYKTDLLKIEALLMGQANLLNEPVEEKNEYYKTLQNEYHYLLQLHSFPKTNYLPKFFPIRPSNFPTIRLAQLAMIIHKSSFLYSKVKEQENLSEIEKHFRIPAGQYWLNHYHFQDKPHPNKPKQLGKPAISGIIINCVVPVLFAQGLYMKDQVLKEKALNLLSNLPPEINGITNSWIQLGHIVNNAFESQAMIELKNNYCDEKKCLDCAFGNKILRLSNEEV